ncbi:MAG: carbohydrate-binding protein [Spirochaetales bacterium]|nr:carbohydrate-binding protein [Spirochaetales bacterium]
MKKIVNWKSLLICLFLILLVSVNVTARRRTTSTSTPTPASTAATQTNTPIPTAATQTNTPIPTPTSGVSYRPIPGTIQAEDYDSMSGIQTETTTDTGGGTNVGWIEAGDWMEYNVTVASTATYSVQYRVAALSTTGGLSFLFDGATLGTTTIPVTGGWQTWTTVTGPNVSLSSGNHVIRLSATTAGFNINWFSVTSGSVNTSTPTPTQAQQSTATPTTAQATATPTRTPTPTPNGSATCGVQSAPSGKVLVGYWESWDGSGVHPGMGWIPLSEINSAYNVVCMAFPVILSDGTAIWENGMDVNVKVPTPAEICAFKASGKRVLISIGGAAAGIDLNTTAVADRFISTIVPILKNNNLDGVDIDLETGLVAGTSFTSLSTSQSNLIRIIDGILAQMPSNFMLTMAPETAYVTGGQIAYGGPWGAYLPIIKRYLDNGRLSWLQMQYYNGSMYGAGGVAYQAGTIEGFVQQTLCMINGFTVAGGGPTITIPASKIVVGLPAQLGAGGGYMSPADVRTAYNQVSSIKGLMTWSINWDGSKGWTFANNKPF